MVLQVASYKREENLSGSVPYSGRDPWRVYGVLRKITDKMASQSSESLTDVTSLVEPLLRPQASTGDLAGAFAAESGALSKRLGLSVRGNSMSESDDKTAFAEMQSFDYLPPGKKVFLFLSVFVGVCFFFCHNPR
jgi:hypothetical protein